MSKPKLDLLTPNERRAIRLTAQLTNLYLDIVGDDISREGDLAEFVADVHRIQHRIMAQAAARAYPEQFRLLGEVIQ